MFWISIWGVLSGVHANIIVTGTVFSSEDFWNGLFFESIANTARDLFPLSLSELH